MQIQVRLGSALLAMLFAGGVCAEVEIVDAYVRGLPPGVANSSAYMRLLNTGVNEVQLTGGSSPAADSVMLHSTVNHNGMLHMTHLPAVTIPSGGEVRLESGGTHLMLMGLKEALPAGAMVELTLQFADGSTQTFEAPVRSVLDE